MLFPDNEKLGLATVCCLAALAGAVDACGLSLLHDLYVSFMSGNTTSLGAAIAEGNLARAGLIGLILAVFVGGAAFGTIAATLAGPHRLSVILALIAPLLAVPSLTTHGAAVALTFAMGMLNASMQQAGPISVSVTYVTGTLVKLGRGLGLFALGKTENAEWLLQAVPWLGLFAGAVAATFGLHAGRSITFAALPVTALIAAVIAWRIIPAKAIS